MRWKLVKPTLVAMVVATLVVVAYGAVSHVSGQAGSSGSADGDDPLTMPARPGYTPVPVQTPEFAPSWPSANEMGELVPGGTIYEKLGVPIALPSHAGDFRIWIGLRDPGGLFAAVYQIDTGSTLFLEPKDDADGRSLVESNRDVKQPEANDVFDRVTASIVEVAR